jgi:hypothetical protein
MEILELEVDGPGYGSCQMAGYESLCLFRV